MPHVSLKLIQIMKKILTTTALFLSIGGIFAQEARTNYWANAIHDFYKGMFCCEEWTSFNIYCNNEFSRTVICHNPKDNNPSVTTLYELGFYHVTTDTIKHISITNNDYLTFARNELEWDFKLRQKEYSQIHPFEIYSPLPNPIGYMTSFKAKKIKINGTKYLVFFQETISSHVVYDENGYPIKENGQYRLQKRLRKRELYFNRKNNVFDSAVVSIGDQTNIFTAKNFSFENRQHVIDSVFDKNNPEYANYTHLNGKVFSPPEINGKKDFSDIFWNFPLLSTLADTIHLKNTSGWRLLNFWTIGCRPCYEQFLKYSREKDSLNMLFLESNGIKVYCIEPSSPRIDLIKKVADQFNLDDIMFSAKGIGRHIKLEGVPEYILISPDNKVIFRTCTIDNYIKILELKNKTLKIIKP